MRNDGGSSTAASSCPEPGEPGDLLTGRIADIKAWLAGVDAADLSDRERIRVVTALEEAAGALAGAQARMTAAYAESQRSLGCSVRGVAAEVGLARRVNLSRAARLVSAAQTLVDDLPETMGLLESGWLSEARAVQVAGQVGDLDPAERQEVDELLAEDLPRLGDAEVRDAVDAAITRIDPDAVEARRRAACRQRRVTVRPTADGMAWLSIHTTAIEAAAALNTLHAHADSVIAGTGGLADIPEAPEGRAHAEIMADAALSRLTGRSVHEGPPVEIQLVMTDTALLPPRSMVPSGGASPANAVQTAYATRVRHSAPSVARVVGVGPVPAGVARELIRHIPAALAVSAAAAGESVAWVDPAAAPAANAQSIGGAESTHRPPRMFEGPDWDLDDQTDEQRHQAGAEDRARWRLDDREATRVTLRRVHLSPGGRNPFAVDARRRVMPTAARDPDRAEDPEVHEWFARLRAPAQPHELATLTSGQRCARGLLRLLVVLRDQRCRVPWCTAPIRHVDHVTPHRDLPLTDAVGLAGACVGHNLAKEDPGHTVTVTHDGTGGTTGSGPHTIVWTTPTGHTYTGVAPPILGWGTHQDDDALRPADDANSPLEAHLTELLAA